MLLFLHQLQLLRLLLLPLVRHLLLRQLWLLLMLRLLQNHR